MAETTEIKEQDNLQDVLKTIGHASTEKMFSTLNADRDVSSNKKFPVYVAFSRWSLSHLDSFLSKYGPVGFLRIVYEMSKNGQGPKETDRNIVIISDETYNKLCAAGYYNDGNYDAGREFKIAPFVLNDNNYPGPGRLQSLFVPVPQIWMTSDPAVSEVISNKLKHLASWGILPKDSWKITVPVRSRATGGVKGGCYINFDKDVTLPEIAMARVVLTDTNWPDYPPSTSAGKSIVGTGTKGKFVKAVIPVERSIFRCFWTRTRTPLRAGISEASDESEEVSNLDVSGASTAKASASPSALPKAILPRVTQPSLLPVGSTPVLPKLVSTQPTTTHTKKETKPKESDWVEFQQWKAFKREQERMQQQ